MTDARFVPCTACGSEGRVYRTRSGHPNDPDTSDEGPCGACDGTGREEVAVEPITEEEAAKRGEGGI